MGSRFQRMRVMAVSGVVARARTSSTVSVKQKEQSESWQGFYSSPHHAPLSAMLPPARLHHLTSPDSSTTIGGRSSFRSPHLLTRCMYCPTNHALNVVVGGRMEQKSICWPWGGWRCCCELWLCSSSMASREHRLHNHHPRIPWGSGVCVPPGRLDLQTPDVSCKWYQRR